MPGKLAAPEYFVPAGVAYDPCMLTGTCSDGLLQQIRNTPMTMTLNYLRVERVGCELTRIPLRAVGPAWSPSVAGWPAYPADAGLWREESPSLAALEGAEALTYYVYLPLILNRYGTNASSDDPTGCPCGWFAEDGRMVDFIPAP
jgi:hypothetical protein